MNSGNLNFLEPSGPLQACNGTDLPFYSFPGAVHCPDQCYFRADSHYTSRFPFRRGTSPFSKIFSCVIKRRRSHWQERLRQVSVPFRRRCWARMFDVAERVRTGLYLPDSDNVNSLTSPPLHFECLVATSAACFFFRNGWKINRIDA